MWWHQWFNSFFTSYLHIKKSKHSKENYKPISILPYVSKIYERCLYHRMATYFELIFSRYWYGFCNGYSEQHCLLAMIDPSKVLDCIPHNHIIAKLEAYGFHIDALKLIYNCFPNRKRRVKVNDAYTKWKDRHRDPYSVLYNSVNIFVTALWMV